MCKRFTTIVYIRIIGFLLVSFSVSGIQAQNRQDAGFSFGVSASENFLFENSILPNKNKGYCSEVEGFVYIYPKSEKPIFIYNIAAGMKDFNIWYDDIRFLTKYFTFGCGLSYQIPLNNKWRIEIPVDFRLNFGKLHKSEYFQTPPSQYKYFYSYTTIQMKSGVMFSYQSSHWLSFSLFLKGKYAIGSKNDDLNKQSIFLGDNYPILSTGLLFTFNLRKK